MLSGGLEPPLHRLKVWHPNQLDDESILNSKKVIFKPYLIDDKK
jgi:hypothetical protein